MNDNTPTRAAELEAHRRFLDGPPIATMRGDEVPVFAKLGDLASWVATYYEDRFGSIAVHPQLGSTVIDRRSVVRSIGHGMNAAKGQAFFLVPTLIESGRILLREQLGNLEGIFLGAPIRIGDDDYVAVALVRRDANVQRFYLHEAVAIKKLRSPFYSGASAEAGERTAGAGVIRSLLRDIFSVNPPGGDYPL